MTTPDTALLSELSKINDPRLERRKRHKLIDIFTITVCAVICGANTWNEIAQYGESKRDWLKTLLELPNGIPSHDTIRRVFIIIDPEEFRTAFINWVDSIRQIVPNNVIAVDGKTVRRSHDKANGKSAIHMINLSSTSLCCYY